MKNFKVIVVRLILLVLIFVIAACEALPTSVDDYDKYTIMLAIQNSKNMNANIRNVVAVKPRCIDVDGYVYNVVKIGDQWWMAENLKVKHYYNRDPIRQVTDKKEWKNTKLGAYCYYNNDKNIADEYGLLYNWKAITDKRGIAPKGWRVPSDSDFQILEYYLGGRGKAGGKLKEKGTGHWAYPNNASNSSGFTALPGGQRDNRGDYSGMPGFGFLWSTTTSQISGAWNRYLDHMYIELERSNFNKRCGFSVRCVLESNKISVIRVE